MGDLDLYPAQKRGVHNFLALKRPRMILAYGTGCGKTPTAIRCLQARQARGNGTRNALLNASPRTLVVCPAIVRRHWVREFERWADTQAHAIEMGRKTKGGTKAQRAARDAAYAAPVQVVSYDLLGHVDNTDWDAIVFDEVHHLADCTSKQSKVARWVMEQNPDAMALGLSATLIPTELWQLWHPLYLLFGAERWGGLPRAGKFCWPFVSRFCEIERNEYGAKPGRALPHRQAELRQSLAATSHRLTRQDIAADLPPIDISVLETPGNEDVVKSATEWIQALEADVTHAVVLVYHRDVAARLYEAAMVLNWPALVIDGAMSTAQRASLLDSATDFDRLLVIATTESIREGIRLMWAQKVLLAQWRQSPKQVLQVLGRFNSVGDTRRPQIQVLVSEDQITASKKLMARMEAVNAVLRAGSAENAVAETFASAELSEASILRQTHAMLELGPRGLDADWLEDTGDFDEW